MSNFLKQATASQVRALGPFLDDTDFKTAETGLTIANTDIKLIVNGAASANKNSGGGTHRVNGIYGVTFDATDTATVGEMEVSVVVAGALPVFKTFFVVEETVYDALYASGAAGFGAGSITTADLGVIASGTAQSGSTTTTIVLAAATSFANDLVNNMTVGIVSGTGAGQARVIDDWDSASDTATVSPAWDVTPDNTSAYRVWMTAPGSTTNYPLVKLAPITHTSAVIPTVSTVSSVAAFAANSITAAATAADFVTEVQAGLSTSAEITTVASNVTAIQLVTTKLNTAVELDGSVYRFTVNALELAPSGTGASAATIRDAIFARTFEATKMSGLTFEEIVALGATALFGKVSGLPTAPVFRNLGDTANAISATTDTSGNRSSITTTLASVR